MSRSSAPQWPVMHALLAQGAKKPTHARIAELAFVNKKTVYNVVRDGGTNGHLIGGRPARFGPGLGLVLSLSLGSETLRAGLVDCNGMIHCQSEAQRDPNQLSLAPRALMRRLGAIVVKVLEQGLTTDQCCHDIGGGIRLLGISSSWPSPIDRTKRIRGKAIRDGSWRRTDPKSKQIPTLPERLSSYLGPPFTSDNCHALNDVSAAALAVAFEKSRNQAEDADDDQWRVGLVVRVGGGLGSGTILMAPHKRRRLSFIDSLLVEGTNGLAGELGHLPIGRRVVEEMNEECEADDLAPMDYDDWVCSCKRKHHLEAFASGTAVLRRLKNSGYELPADERPFSSVIREAVENGDDPGVVHAVRDAGRLLGRALTGPILMLDPYSITVTGSLASEHLVEGMRRERDKWANAIEDRVQIDFRAGTEGAYIGVLGAGLAVIRRAVYRTYLDQRTAAPTTFLLSRADLDSLRKRLARAARTT